MSSQKNVQLGAHAVMFAVMNKRNEVIALLLKNGVVAPNNASDMQLAQLVKSLLKSSKSFKKDFFDLLATSQSFSQSFVSMNGEFANASGGVADSSLNLIAATPTDTTPKKSWFTSDNIQGTLNTALNAFLTLDKNKTDRALASASQNVAMYNSQQGGTTIGGTTTTKSNTMLYVILGVLGVALIGGVVYVANKKR